jgi:CheY-like chemotaxis protein
MILLVSSEQEVQKRAPVLSRELGERVECAKSVRTAAAKMREQAFDLLLLDDEILDINGAGVDGLLAHAAGAVPLFFNPAITATNRLVLEARAAQRRRDHDRKAASESALCALRNELRSDVTGILLSSQLALNTPDLPGTTLANLKTVCALAERLSKRLE